MEENSRSLYDEFRVTVSDTEFIFFIDNGFEQRNTYRSENHSHKFNKIIYCLKGSVEIAHEKETQKITAGEMVLIPKKTVHSLSADDDTYYMFLSFWNDDKWQTKKNIMVFKNFPAVNTFERILLLRMNKAKNLLTDTNKSVEEIAVATGYKTAHNFYSAFRAYNGMTPKEYRKNARF